MSRLIKGRSLEFLRFLIVGGLNFLLTLAVYEAVLLVIDYRLAYLISILFGIVFTVIMNIKTVFRTHLSLRSVTSYGVYYILYSGFSLGLLHLVVDSKWVSAVWAPVALQVVLVPFSFLVSRAIIFRTVRPSMEGALSPADLSELARLQCEVLSDSMVSRLGRGYARAYWRYVDRDEDEIALVRRDETGRIAAACSISLHPGRLTLRLLTRTPLFGYLLLHLFDRWFLRMVAAMVRGGSESAPLPPIPEVVMLLTSPQHRRRGLASALLADVEAILPGRGIFSYYVKTGEHQVDAQKFYLANGFEISGRACVHGGKFLIMTKACAVDV